MLNKNLCFRCKKNYYKRFGRPKEPEMFNFAWHIGICKCQYVKIDLDITMSAPDDCPYILEQMLINSATVDDIKTVKGVG